MNNVCKANSLNESNKVASLYSIRKHNLDKLVLAHLNINSLKLKFDSLAQKITGSVDILMLSETKLGNSFPESQFLIEGYSKPYIIDHNCHGEGIMLYGKSRYSIKTSVPRAVTNGMLLCRDRPS